jgi:hypothetical protein
MGTCPLPGWVQMLHALTVPLIAAIGAWVAVQQMRIARINHNTTSMTGATRFSRQCVGFSMRRWLTCWCRAKSYVRSSSALRTPNFRSRTNSPPTLVR